MRVSRPFSIIASRPSGARNGLNSSQDAGSGPPTASGLASSQAAATTSPRVMPIRSGPQPSAVRGMEAGITVAVPPAPPEGAPSEAGADAVGGSPLGIESLD